MEVLRETGIRIEELTELSHHSLVQYRHPSTGQLIPLLHIAPSKTDQERLLVISPELADVLSIVLLRVRGQDGSVPLVAAYDRYERVWMPPMPLIFQRRIGIENRPVGIDGFARLLNFALAATGLADASGMPLTFTPHDFRRIFTTEATLGSPCATSRKPHLMLTRGRRCGMTGPAAAWTGMRPTSSPPTSQAPPGNGTPNWRSFARQ